ncbi:MAG TPA: 5'-nucleotidase C-terminal domain-containing protein [Arenibaculum sp.]|nr:5'-nucleotidase C-terminal domain-containing protein [Arenibaculum sp.]
MRVRFSTSCIRSAVRAAALGVLVAAAPVRAEPATLTFLHVNDLDRMEETDGQGGFARLMTVVKRESEGRDGVLFTHGGDAISPSLLSGFDRGAHIVDLLNEAGVDIMTLGNHEFDFGPDVAVERIAEAEFPIVATNVLRGGELLPGTLGTHIIEAAGLRVGFYGLTTPTTADISSPGDVTFAPLIETARGAAAQLREQGADLVVALAHTAIDEDLALFRADAADVILGGHDHLLMSYYDGRSVVIESASQADYVTVLEIEAERVKDRDGNESVTWSPHIRTISTAGIEPDAGMAAKVEAYLEGLSRELDVPVGTTATPLDSRRAAVRGGETAIGNLFADAMRAGVGADVAITNGGGIRADRTYGAGTTLTRRDIQSELPFGNRTVKLRVTGAQVRQALEHGVGQVAEGAGRFPHVSGMAFTYDPAAEPGSRVGEVSIGGAPLDPDATYTLATNDFMAGGGDGYSVFQGAENLIDPNAASFMASQVMDYVAAQGTVSPVVEGRITELR